MRDKTTVVPVRWRLKAFFGVVLVTLVLWPLAIQQRVSFSGGGPIAAQSNVQSTLTAVKSYYENAGGSFNGMTDAGPLATIHKLTDMSIVVGGTSTRPNVISLDVGDGGTSVVLVAFESGVDDCWGLLDLTVPTPRTVLGISNSVGVYLFVIRHTSSTDCNAAKVTSVTDWLTSGFPRA
jgi:hypothetical protein